MSLAIVSCSNENGQGCGATHGRREKENLVPLKLSDVFNDAEDVGANETLMLMTPSSFMSPTKERPANFLPYSQCP